MALQADEAQDASINTLLSRLSGYTVHHVPAGTQLFSGGQDCYQFVFVISGEARVQVATRNGRNVELFRLQSGQACALTTACLLNDCSYFAEGVAETDMSLAMVPAKEFFELVDTSHAFMRSLLLDYASRISTLTSLVDRISARDLIQEICAFLLARQNVEGRVEYSHKQISEVLGTAREVVSRKLKVLERRGVIALERGVVRVSDPAELQKLSGVSDYVCTDSLGDELA